MTRWLCVATIGVATACAPIVTRPVRSVPQAVQARLLTLPRIWVAGFMTEGTDSGDLNVDTVRLLRDGLLERTGAPVVQAPPLRIDSKARFVDAEFWRRQAEEHGFPLIVTGSVRLLIAPARVEQRGRRNVIVGNTGRALNATVIVIDGATGAIRSTQHLRRRVRYGVGGAASAQGVFFEMMNEAIPEWLAVIGAAPVHVDAQGVTQQEGS